MNVTILHGYSAADSGDGLLVDLAIDTVLRNFGAAFDHIFLSNENIIKGVVR
ncbi:hypothetical protein D3C87_987050 [compost metagenome]